ncbi:unnamed protein product, partial [Polarella glacialis]
SVLFCGSSALPQPTVGFDTQVLSVLTSTGAPCLIMASHTAFVVMACSVALSDAQFSFGSGTSGTSGQQPTSQPTGGAMSGMCKMMPVPGMCPAANKPLPAECVGGICCQPSSCIGIPMLGCRPDRGSTTCVGAGMFSMGTCACKSGGCGGGGKCANNPNFVMSDMNTRLYEETSEGVVAPEDHRATLMGYGAVISGIFGMGFVVGKRLLKGSAREQNSLNLLESDQMELLE